MTKLIIGNKTYSSWSLRPWMLMKHYEIPFEEILIKLDMPETTTEIKKYSPSGKVPALVSDTLVVWDSLAIMEYLNDLFPEKKMYPQDLNQRARARSMVMEMHSGFPKMRESLSFNTKKRYTNFDFTFAQKDIDRMKEIWTEQLTISKGPYLFGEFSIADAMFAPIAGRFETYGVPVDGVVKEYCETIMKHPAMKEWYAGALKEDFVAKDHL